MNQPTSVKLKVGEHALMQLMYKSEGVVLLQFYSTWYLNLSRNRASTI